MTNRPWSEKAEAYWESIGKQPLYHGIAQPRSKTVEEELDRLRQDYLEQPEKRGDIERKAHALQGYLLKNEKKRSEITNDQWATQAEDALQ